MASDPSPPHRRVDHDQIAAREAHRHQVRLHLLDVAIAATDVANECPHERLPGDPCPSPDGVWPHPEPCACWGENVLVPIHADDQVAGETQDEREQVLASFE